MLLRTRRRWTAIGIGAVLALLLPFLFVGGVAADADVPLDATQLHAMANPAGNLDQCATGPLSAPVPCTGSAW